MLGGTIGYWYRLHAAAGRTTTIHARNTVLRMLPKRYPQNPGALQAAGVHKDQACGSERPASICCLSASSALPVYSGSNGGAGLFGSGDKFKQGDRLGKPHGCIHIHTRLHNGLALSRDARSSDPPLPQTQDGRPLRQDQPARVYRCGRHPQAS